MNEKVKDPSRRQQEVGALPLPRMSNYGINMVYRDHTPVAYIVATSKHRNSFSI
jgi:hypothetical protein